MGAKDDVITESYLFLSKTGRRKDNKEKKNVEACT